MDLVIITVSYNTRDLLAECLISALTGLERSGLEGKLWVVDNASSDGSAAMVKQRFPSVELIASEHNLGFSAGNNRALQELGARNGDPPRHTLFLNPDTRVIGDALGTMVRFLDETPPAGAVGPRLVHGDGTFQHSAFGFPGLLQVFFDFYPLHPRLVDSRLNGRYPRKLYEGDKAFVVDHPLGAALMVRGATLGQVGGFDERFFMYCEEIDLCRRIRMAGWDIFCAPQAQIVHYAGQSTRQFRDKMYVALWRSRFLMYELHESAAFCWLVRRIVRLGLLAEDRRARRAFARADIGEAELGSRLAAYEEVAGL